MIELITSRLPHAWLRPPGKSKTPSICNRASCHCDGRGTLRGGRGRECVPQHWSYYSIMEDLERLRVRERLEISLAQ